MKRIIKNINNISDEVKEAVLEKYPDGWEDVVMRIDKPDKSFFHAITVDTEDSSYMIKVDVEVDSIEQLERLESQDDDQGHNDDDTIAGGEEEIKDLDEEN